MADGSAKWDKVNTARRVSAAARRNPSRSQGVAGVPF